MGGEECRKSLTSSNASDVQMTGYGVFYGFPVTFLSTFTDGCFESRVTHISNLSALGLFVDILFIGTLGMAPYWLLLIWRRIRH